ncbi:MAG TPA: hypothetical protein VK009_25555 [Chloroflexota bacterium]|nr:hypothetical protein [Chloroflexota bacterium]
MQAQEQRASTVQAGWRGHIHGLHELRQQCRGHFSRHHFVQLNLAPVQQAAARFDLSLARREVKAAAQRCLGRLHLPFLDIVEGLRQRQQA